MKHAAVLLAASLVVPVTALPDVTGRWEGEIQDPPRPLVVTVDFTAGTASLSGAAPIAMSRRANANDASAVAFDIVLPAQTLRFAGTRTDGRVEGPDRLTAWREDLDVVLTRFLRYDRSIGEPQRGAIRARLEKLKSSVGRKAYAEIVVELARAIALGGNAHTRLYLIRNRTEVRRWPIRVWWFRDELRVVRATPEHADLLGCRLASIGRSGIALAFRRVGDIKAGNPSWQRYMSAYFLTSPDILFGAGLISDPERLTLTLACRSATRRVGLAPLPLTRARD